MQKILSSKTTRVAAVMAGVIGLASLVGCGNSGGTSGSGGTTPTVNATAITIDNAGVIPVFGNSSTSTVVYVHNNSSTTISGISYSAVNNTAKANTSLSTKLRSLFKSNKSLSSVNGSQCSSIAAGQSCPLSIVTPVLSELNTRGSMDVKASYSLNNKPVIFNQIINYEQVQNNAATSGAKFKAGTAISSYGNSTGYATIYLYGSGQNQVYNVSSITINKPAVTIVNGNISGHQIQSNFVQAVEVSSPILSSSISATITVNSSTLQTNNVQSSNSSKSKNKSLNSKSLLSGDQFSNSVDLAVEPTAAGAILTTGLVPLINTVSTTSGSLFVQNAGNQNAVLGSASADAGISNLSGCSGETLAPAASCTISFNVTESGGSGNITIPYTGGSASSIATNVTWFNGVGAALVSMSASENPVTFPATGSGNTTVTVTNIGGYTLRNISIPTPIVISGSAASRLEGENTCASIESLPVGSSCSYDVNVTDNETDLFQQINLGFNATYAGTSGTQSYSRVMPLAYSSTAYGAIIAITPTDPSLTISGNNFESTTQVLTISNSGNVSADILNVLSNNPAYLTESATTCDATLAAETSCTSTVQFGPTYSAESASGSAAYTVNYTAAEGQSLSGSVVSNIAWNVQSYAQSISLTSQTAFGHISGNGESAGTQYVFTARGRDLVGKSITLDYTNTGTNELKITGIQDSNSVYTWQIGGDGTTCSAGTILPPSGTCKLVYTSMIESNILALGASVGTSYTENLLVPTLIYQDANNSNVQFNAQPNLPTGGTTIYAQSNQATLANSVTVNEIGTSNESVTVNHLLANADDALNVTVTTKMEDYFIEPPVRGSADCTSNSADGIKTQTCIMGTGDLSMSATYMVNQTLLTPSSDLILTALFSTDQLSQIVSMNPILATANLGSAPSIVAVGTAGTILTSRDGVTWESTNYGANYLNGVTYADNQFVAVGEAGVVYTSTNGLSWATQTSGTAEELFEVTYGSNLFVSVGCQGTIITSPNAKSWSTQTAIDNCDIYGVTYGSGLYVASGLGGRIQTSPDGFTWTAQTSGVSDELTAVTYGNGLYVAVGTNGAILTSPDGVTWTPRVSSTTAQIGSILYAGGQFVAGVRDGTILTSPDGISWTSRVTSNVNPLYGIAYSNGKYIAVGTLGTILTSLDGVTWVTRESITSESLYGVVGLSSL